MIAQLAYWVRTKEGRQRQALQAWLTRLVEAMHGRVHGFNVSVAHVWAEQERLLERAGERIKMIVPKRSVSQAILAWVHRLKFW